MEHAEDLAEFMMTGRVHAENKNFYRNAEAIAALLGSGIEGSRDPLIIAAIDRLTTLYAVDKVGPAARKSLLSLAQSEAEGLDFLVHYLADLRRKELSKHRTAEARFNHYKGYAPSEAADGVSLVVRDDSEHNRLISEGYTRVGTYRGSGVEGGSKGYYFSTVAGRGTYNQGVLQTVQTSASGVDPRTGRTLSGITAGAITGNQVAVIRGRLQGLQKFRGEPLIPVFDADGNVAAYERLLDPDMVRKLDRNTNLAEMLGAWAGRQVNWTCPEKVESTN